VHAIAVQLAPVLAAEKSKTPFYVAGGLLVLWALILSLGIGLRRPEFPGGLAGQRAVCAISAVLVLAAISTAVVTSGGTTATAGAQPASSQSSPTTATPAPPSSPAAGASSKLKLATNPAGQLSYDTKQLSAKAGRVTIELSNSAPIEHDVAIAQGNSILGQTPVFTGGTRSVTVKLAPGTYTFFCTVPGHRQAGMEGTLTVS
jgi:uncharacterized cupredoxin-like copper-binding protein